MDALDNLFGIKRLKILLINQKIALKTLLDNLQ